MRIEEIEELIQLIERSEVEEFELERKGTRIRIRKPSGETLSTVTRDVSLPAAAPEDSESVKAGQEEADQSPEEELHVFTAPIVGTVYLTPKPDADSLVEVGSKIEPGQVVCIIEAMKIFNQIESDVEGELVRILVKNGQPIEFGEALFEIRLSSQ